MLVKISHLNSNYTLIVIFYERLSLFLVRQDILYFCKEAFIKWRGTKDIVKTSETYWLLCTERST